MKTILAIDTSSPVLSLAFKTGDHPVAEVSKTGYLSHVENLLPLLDEILAQHQLSSQAIDTFLIGRGPGSFTGLRVGFATLKAFCFSQKIDCYGALSLDMIADNTNAPEVKTLGVCLDAHRAKIYTRFYQRYESSWQPVEEPRLFTIEELMARLPAGCHVSGNALEKYSEIFQSLAESHKVTLRAETEWYPKAASLIAFFNAQSAKLVPLEKPDHFLPLYLRLSEPEEKRLNVHAS